MELPFAFMCLVGVLNCCFLKLSGEMLSKTTTASDKNANEHNIEFSRQFENLYYDSSDENWNNNSSSDFYDGDKSSIEKKGSEPRLLSQSAFNRISETLGALNTVGSFIVNITRGGGQYLKEEPEQTSSTSPTVEMSTDTPVLTDNYSSSSQSTTIDKRIGIAEANKEIIITEEKKKKKKKNKNKVKKQPEQSVASSKVDLIINATTEEVITSTFKPLALIASHSIPTSNIDEELKGKDSENRCRTSTGLPGRCEDLSSCPGLLLNLSSLRESLCFKSLFVPGVCCPIQDVLAIETTTQKPLKLTSSTKTTKRPNLVLIPHIQYTTTVRTTTVDSPTIDEIGNSLESSDDCGQQEHSSGRIVGGYEAQTGQWPWMAAIFLHGSKRTEFWCGGTLIGSKYILTAAHCTIDSRQKPFAARQFTVRLGDVDLSRDDEISSPETFGVKEVRAHERFSRMGFYNDIAVLVLDRPARKSKYIIPICLPNARQMPMKHLLPGRKAVVVGWGTTYYGGKESATQRHASIPIWRNEDCDQSYFQPINENFICAGLSEGGVDACQGDSGGPLLMKYNSHWTQVGIVSFGNKCGEPGYPGVYTRVSQYINWIQDHTRN